MSYDLAVWEGSRPASDEAAAALYEQLMDRMETDAVDVGPSTKMRAYVDALLERWPNITDDAGEDSPWADGPLIGNAFGDSIYLSMTWSRAEEASAFAAQLADEHGLVCYDPQAEILRPPVRPEKRKRSWFGRSG